MNSQDGDPHTPTSNTELRTSIRQLATLHFHHPGERILSKAEKDKYLECKDEECDNGKGELWIEGADCETVSHQAGQHERYDEAAKEVHIVGMEAGDRFALGFGFEEQGLLKQRG